MLNNNFDKLIDRWIEELEQKSFARICAKPSPTSWSLGQVGMHLLEATRHYLEEVSICLSNDSNEGKEMSPNAKSMFNNNEFPDERIEGPPSNDDTPQPGTREELIADLRALKAEIDASAILISTSTRKGKTKHPGLHYFSAREWFQFAEMHFRHHTRQKKRIEEFLKTA